MAKVCLHLLPPISEYLILHLGGNSCVLFYPLLSAWEYAKIKRKYPLTELLCDLKWVATRVKKP